MQRILLSLGMIVFVGAIAAGATGAFFNDTETSTGNTFAAGDIDLQIDNESFAIDYNMDPQDLPGEHVLDGSLLFNPGTSWAMTDLIAGTHKFFDFSDLKPGDYGEDTISIHVGSNDAWMCAAARITSDDDVTCTEPENADDPNCAEPGLGLGELGDELNIAFWKDDGDNVLEVGEETSIFLAGAIGNLNNEGKIALSDSSNSGPYGNTPIPGNNTVYIGKGWCFGTMAAAPLAQDGLGSTLDDGEPGTGTNGPDVRGTGFSCDGSQANNAAQTDVLEGDMQFYAVQARNNANFTCAENYTPEWPVTVNDAI